MSLRSWPEGCKPLEDLERAGQVSEPARLGAAPTPAMESEKAFLQAIRVEAKKHGWRTYHTHDSRKSEAGFPDLVLVRRGILIFAELKVGDNKPTADQANWLEDLAEVGSISKGLFVVAVVWRPEEWPAIMDRLR